VKQVRKYTGDPYIVHPMAVAMRWSPVSIQQPAVGQPGNEIGDRIPLWSRAVTLAY